MDFSRRRGICEGVTWFCIGWKSKWIERSCIHRHIAAYISSRVPHGTLAAEMEKSEDYALLALDSDGSLGLLSDIKNLGGNGACVVLDTFVGPAMSQWSTTIPFGVKVEDLHSFNGDCYDFVTIPSSIIETARLGILIPILSRCYCIGLWFDHFEVKEQEREDRKQGVSHLIVYDKKNETQKPVQKKA